MEVLAVKPRRRYKASQRKDLTWALLVSTGIEPIQSLIRVSKWMTIVSALRVRVNPAITES